MAGRGERLGKEHDIRMQGRDLVQEPLPERQRLGVRIVDAEDAHPEVDPVPHDPQDFLPQSDRVVVEVERVDVLVFLRWVLGVGDAAVREVGEPFRMLRHPGMVR